MKTFIATLCMVVLCVSVARAQILVEVKFDQEQFLSGETLPASVRITNRSGRTLHLGDDDSWLTFSVESRDGFIVSKNGDAPVRGEFTLETSKVATKRVDLAPYFELTRLGRYRVTATVRIKEWGAQITSPPKDFDIIEGAQLWTREFGVPDNRGSNQPPEMRRYTLLQANTLRSQIRLYFRLSDGSESRVLKVFQLGQMVSFARPDVEVDGRSRLHILQQNGPRSSIYAVIGPDGELLKRQFYDFAGGHPRLQWSRDGNISVAGGTRRVTKDDLPSEKASDKD